MLKMYLALKWLAALSLFMWALLCTFEWNLKRSDLVRSTGPTRVKQSLPGQRNTSYLKTKTTTIKPYSKVKIQSNPHEPQVEETLSHINYITFVSGALVVILYNRKKEISVFAKQNFQKYSSKMYVTLHKIALCVQISVPYYKLLKHECVRYIQECIVPKIIELAHCLRSFIDSNKCEEQDENYKDDRNKLLLKRLRDVVQERNKLSQLLITTIQENKNYKMQWHAEKWAKNKLLQQINDTQNQMKDQRSKYVNFQQLYLVTHQENTFLKSRIKKLSHEKNEAESNLMRLINKIYQCNDNNLKAYCTCFVIKTKEKLLTEKVNTEIQNFMQMHRSRNVGASTSGTNINVGKNRPEDNVDIPLIQDGVVHFVPNEKPKLRGIPGEYVWTVKDKDGIIEKLYEYDYGGLDIDNGDNIRRIREYSVYHDKDCLLDLATSSSTTIIHDRKARGAASQSTSGSLPRLPTRRFLSDSPAFQNFMRSTHSLIPMTRTFLGPPLLSR